MHMQLTFWTVRQTYCGAHLDVSHMSRCRTYEQPTLCNSSSSLCRSDVPLQGTTNTARASNLNGIMEQVGQVALPGC
eukprot:2408789-Amphidinium_carterae.1